MAKAKKKPEEKKLDLTSAATEIRLPPRRHGETEEEQQEQKTRYGNNAQVYVSADKATSLKVYCAKNGLRMKAVLDKLITEFLVNNGVA